MTNHQREDILTMGPVQPDEQDAINSLLGISPVERLALDEVDVAMMIEEENLSLTSDANVWSVGRSCRREHSCFLN